MTNVTKKCIIATIGMINVAMFILGVLNVVTCLLGITITVCFQWLIDKAYVMNYRKFRKGDGLALGDFPMYIGKNVEQAIIIFNCMASNSVLMLFMVVASLAISMICCALEINSNSFCSGIAVACICLSMRELYSTHRNIKYINEDFEDTSFKIPYLLLDTALAAMVFFKHPILEFLKGHDLSDSIIFIALGLTVVYLLLLMYIVSFRKVRLHIKYNSVKLNTNREIGKSDIFVVMQDGEHVEYSCDDYYPIIKSDGCCIWERTRTRYRVTGKLVEIRRNS